MHTPEFRLPAEWEPQDGVLIAWPHAGTDWAARLAEVETTYVALASAIARFEAVRICVADTAMRQHVEQRLAEAGTDLQHVGFIELPYDDTWLRDSGPITLVAGEGSAYVLNDFHFTGWGGKYGANQDDALIGGLVAHGLFTAATHRRIDWALEGGAIESDGQGTLLTTWRCLHQRHPSLERAAMSGTLRRHLHAPHVLWLDHGYLEGDDTDAHIDTLARLAPGNAIVYQACDDPGDSHYEELARMAAELAQLRTADGAAFTLHALPWPRPIIEDGRRLAASYANYLIVNDAVLIPAYGDAADDAAARVIAHAHPGREVVKVPCRPLIWQNGSLHCVTMQLPRGVLA